MCARVITPPTLGREVVVTIETEDDTATGNFLELFMYVLQALDLNMLNSEVIFWVCQVLMKAISYHVKIISKFDSWPLNRRLSLTRRLNGICMNCPLYIYGV